MERLVQGARRCCGWHQVLVCDCCVESMQVTTVVEEFLFYRPSEPGQVTDTLDADGTL
jgi:hypothetical protein